MFHVPLGMFDVPNS